ncbi:MAG: M28 family peptidase [Treponema sp.]|jgi:hypothetical protein|nr:M28 family peptidase [Treponema sp.]
MLINRKYIRILCTVITLTIGIILGFWQTKPPRVNKSSRIYPVYERMMANLQKMSAKPHPSNSAEIKIVRAYLLEEIENMGLIPIIQDVVFTREELKEIFFLKGNGVSSLEELWEKFHELLAKNQGIYSLDELIEFNKNFEIGDVYEVADKDGNITLQNIMVKLDASDTDRGVLFMAHYDSAAEEPGAADNMLGVVSLLEALRLQAQNKTLKTDLYFLLSDGEEQKITDYRLTEGTKQFVKEYPELKNKVDMVINFEARGNRGALVLFETSPNAYRLVDACRKSGAWLYGFSALDELYNISPYVTDLTNFLNEGYNGLNFAAIEGVQVYHNYDDSYENLNRTTAWHYLQTVLSFADYTANNTLEDLQKSARGAVFFPFLPGYIVLMTDIVSHILCAIAFFLALAVIALSVRNKRLKPALSTILMCLLIPASIICSIIYTAGSYLLYIPLLLMAITVLVKRWLAVYLAVKMVSSVIVLMLWVPIIISVWWGVIVPMML